MTDFIFAEVNRILKKHRTRDPYELLDAIGVVTKISYKYPCDGLKGYCTILNRTQYVVVNGNLSDSDMKIVAGHEAGHLILHQKLIMKSPIKTMKDFNLYDNSGRTEREANFFLADFVISDEDALDMIESGYDYFTAALTLCIPSPLLAFKLYSMIRRGYKVQSSAGLDSRFLSHS